MRKKHVSYKSPMKTTKQHFQTSSRGAHPTFAAGDAIGNNQHPAQATACQGECVGDDMDADDIAGGAKGG